MNKGRIQLCLRTLGELLALKPNEKIRWVDFNVDRGIFYLTITETMDNSQLKTSKLDITMQAIADLIALPANADIIYGKLTVDSLTESLLPTAVLELYVHSNDDEPIEGLTFVVPEGQEIPVSEIYRVSDNTVGELKYRIYESVRNALIEVVPESENIFIETGDK